MDWSGNLGAEQVLHTYAGWRSGRFIQSFSTALIERVITHCLNLLLIARNEGDIYHPCVMPY